VRQPTRQTLIAASPFTPRLSAEQVAAAIARGLTAGGMPHPDLCPLPERAAPEQQREILDAVGFDTRMLGARAVILAAESLHEQTLAGSIVFEIATRARQAGVPAYAVTAENALSAFDARILDLQLIIEAAGAAALRRAGARLAGVV